MKLNPKDLEKAMKKMGVKQEAIDAREVVIKCGDRELVFSNPTVQKVSMGGQDSYQITGSVQEREAQKFTDEDVEMVMEKTGQDEAAARKALSESEGDLAQAILSLE